MTNAVGTLRIVRINPDIENEGIITFRTKVQLLHFQSSARSAKKSNDFFGLMYAQDWVCLFLFIAGSIMSKD